MAPGEELQFVLKSMRDAYAGQAGYAPVDMTGPDLNDEETGFTFTDNQDGTSYLVTVTQI